MRAMLFLLLLASLTSAEEYQCVLADGCSAQITRDGELQTVDFRRGDIVSTEVGWLVSPDDGWEKVRTNTHTHCGGLGVQLRLMGASAPVPFVAAGRPYLRARPQGAFRSWASDVWGSLTRPQRIPNDYTLIR